MLRLSKKMERAEKEALEGKTATTSTKESAGDSKKVQ